MQKNELKKKKEKKRGLNHMRSKDRFAIFILGVDKSKKMKLKERTRKRESRLE